MKRRYPIWLASLLMLSSCGGSGVADETPSAAMQATEAATSGAPAKEPGKLGTVFLAYNEALANVDYPTLATLTADQLQTRFTGAADLPEEERGQIAQLLQMTRLEDPRIALERIEGQRGILVAEAFGENPLQLQFEGNPAAGLSKADHKPIEMRRYTVVFFTEEEGSWRILRESQFSYHDPRPIFQTTDGDQQLDTLNVQFHCGFAGEANTCADAGLRADECWKCFAQLERDAAHCNQVGRDLEAQDAEFFALQIRFRRHDCQLQVAALTGDADLCSALPEEPILSRSFRQDCVAQIADHDFLGIGTNLFDLDADGDGLTDRLEVFFNTSVGSADTDGDGVDDFQEVMRDMTNPLGEGRLGDHLE